MSREFNPYSASATENPAHLTVLDPVRPSERIATLDFLRGFALLGILIINMPGFNLPWGLVAGGQDLFPDRWDKVAEWLVDFFGSGKFNSIFSFLFGVGFAIQIERAAVRGRSIVGPYLRRLLALFVFGVIHNLLIWNGDVLHIYAILGVPLLLLRRAGDRWLLALAVLLLLAPIGHGAWEFARGAENPRSPAQHRAAGERQRAVYGHGTYVQAVALRWEETRREYWEEEGVWFWPILGTTVLLGFVAGRRRIFQELPVHLPSIRRLAWWTGIVGFSMAGAFATFSALAERGSDRPTLLGSLGGLFYVLGRPVLCVFYIAAIVLLTQKPGWRKVFWPLGMAGRMPLTNYLMQSVVATLIFYSYGLGYYGRVGPALGVGLALAIFALQVVVSSFWMRWFSFGPMEWLWRVLTYGRVPSVRAPAAS